MFVDDKYATKKKTVKRRIFLSNARMLFSVFVFILFINLIIVKVYWESLEQEMLGSAEMRMNDEEIEEMVQEFTIRRKEFILVFLADGILCAGVLVVVSQLFMGNLARRIMEPLAALSEGAERIQDNLLTREIEYTGDEEFEEVCSTFNHMQKYILREQEKNQKYEKARTDMIAGISHDLRTPLTAVKGTLKGLNDGIAETPEQQKKFLETALRRTGDMEALLDQLIYLSKLETGNVPVFLKVIDISAFVRDYVETKEGLAELENVKLNVETGGIAVHVCADPDQLQRIFDNLLENSRKYANVAPLKIRITLSREKRGVCICFSDNGAGVSREKLPNLFDEFYRGDESRNKKEGSGLGLYIVKCLMEAMGGSVWAESVEGLSIYMVLPVETSYGKHPTGVPLCPKNMDRSRKEV